MQFNLGEANASISSRKQGRRHMLGKSVSRMLMLGSQIMIVCGLLASGASTMAQSMDGRCSNRTIFGDYGSDSRGSLLPAPGVAIAFNGLTMTHFDGKGNLTWVEHEVVGGNPLNPGWLAASGTYSVNPDCTGLAVVITPNSPVPLNLYFVVVKHGQEIHAVLDSNAISTVFIRVE
jgi:hypothetical protein